MPFKENREVNVNSISELGSSDLNPMETEQALPEKKQDEISLDIDIENKKELTPIVYIKFLV